MQKAMREAEPLGQNTTDTCAGFGWLYYALARNLRPETTVVIGSRKGFTPLCLARAAQDNGSGQVLLIDPGYSGENEPGWGGVGFWSDAARVAEHFAAFGQTDRLTHLKMTSTEAVPAVTAWLADRPLDLLVIDGSHTFENCLQDFDEYTALMNGGYVVLHDAASSQCDVPQVIEALRWRGLEIMTLERDVGLALVKLPAETPGWPYLDAPSNRAQKLARHLRRLVRPGDRVMDCYCGSAPMAPFLQDCCVFGWDRDARQIAQLRRRFPQQQWMALDERFAVTAELPPECDVLLGLGISGPYAPQDPNLAKGIIDYSLNRYRPSLIMLETPAD